MDKKEESRGRGRPPKPKNEKQAPVTFRLSAQDRVVIDHAAMIAGLSRTEFIRKAAMEASKRELERDEA